MKLRELLKDIEVIKTNADPGAEVANVRYDSRLVGRGDMFVAIKGFEADGHDYIGRALASGAVAIICTEPQGEDIPYVQVENSRLALALASRNYFGNPAAGMKIIGVTGTNGKTTTTTLIKYVLEKVTGVKVGLIGTNGNIIGELVLETERTTPESYDLQALFRRMADAGCEYVVMEVASHALALDRVGGVEFEVGVFSNLTHDHLDFHGTMDEYARVKSLLFRMCKKGCVNIDDEYAGQITDGATSEIMTFSTRKNEADIVAKDIKLSGGNVKFCAVSTGMIERMTLNIPGLFSVYNALAVVSAGLCLGLEASDIAAALETARGVPGRMETVPTDGDYTVVIDYAHTPDALENVLKTLREAAVGRVVALFGCGGDRDKTKRPLMGGIAAANADFAIVTSDNPRTEVPRAIIDDILAGMPGAKSQQVVIEDRREAIAYALDNAQPGDVILLAGKGQETYQIIGKTKTPMDERIIVAEHLAGRK